MAKGSAKSKTREMYLMDKTITADEVVFALDDEILESTAEKYLIEFRQTLSKHRNDTPDTISMTHLEKELAHQLEVNPNSAVIKSCIDFLKLKQVVDDTAEEIDMEMFIKKGKEQLDKN